MQEPKFEELVDCMATAIEKVFPKYNFALLLFDPVTDHIKAFTTNNTFEMNHLFDQVNDFIQRNPKFIKPTLTEAKKEN